MTSGDPAQEIFRADPKPDVATPPPETAEQVFEDVGGEYSFCSPVYKNERKPR
jgi:hypothetical protein